MRHLTLLALSSFLALGTGCPGSGLGPLLTNGEEMPDRESDDSWTGNLSDGSVIDLDWATSGGFACYPGTETTNFTGAHVFVNDALSANVGDFFARVNPSDPTVDVSLYVLKLGVDTTEFPPDLPSAVACDTSFDRENNGNPGVSEAAVAQGGSNPYRIVVGVAGANDATSGGYEVEVWYGE